MEYKKSTYTEKLLDPRWQRKRLEILGRDNFICQGCCDTENTLHVHHRYYIAGREPWDYPPEILVTLCKDCHQHETEMEGDEQDLIKILKCKGFLIGDIKTLAQAFHGMDAFHIPSVMADTIKGILGDRKRLNQALISIIGKAGPKNA